MFKTTVPKPNLPAPSCRERDKKNERKGGGMEKESKKEREGERDRAWSTNRHMLSTFTISNQSAGIFLKQCYYGNHSAIRKFNRPSGGQPIRTWT